MYNNYLLILLTLLFNFFICAYSKEIKNDNYIVGILRNENDKNYDDVSINIQKEIDEFINDKMNDIYNIIKENKDTYGKDDEKLNELNSIQFNKRSNETEKLLFINKRLKSNHNSVLSSEFSKSSKGSKVEYIPIESTLVNHICPISNYYAINVYLSDETAKIVRNMKNVIFCEKSINLKSTIPKPLKHKEKRNNYSNINNNDINNNDINNNDINNNDNDDNDNDDNNSKLYYNINAIKKETQWSDVSVQEISYTPNHLSLLSQSPLVNKNKTIDFNFYYPSSAGKGIDIYLIDQGLYSNHEDFNRYEGTEDERTITCDAIVKDNDVYITKDDEEERYQCSGDDDYPYHGTMVSSMAGGTLYGVSKKANIHMIGINVNTLSTLKSLDYILLHGKPHKTVISISIGFYFYDKALDDKLTDLINKGFIIVTGAGNDENNYCVDKYSDHFFSFQGYRKSIVVGAIDTELNGDGYTKSFYSNYGNCVDIFAPGLVTFPYNEYGSTTDVNTLEGTSCATPIVAGIIASIMSEHPEIKFNNESMRKTLIEMSIKDKILFPNLDDTKDTPNRFVNNGKRSIYYPDNVNIQCGKSSNNNNNNGICSEGCCTKDGECISFENHPDDKCFIENGCQSEFGYCTTKEKSIEECENEIKENEECLIEISLDLTIDDIITQCNTFNSQKCQIFYQNQFSNRSICSIAKEFKQFKKYDDFDFNKYNNNKNICNDHFGTDIIKCKKHITSFNDCILEEELFDDFNNTEIDELKENKYFVETCGSIKSDKCEKFYKNIEEEILSYPSCSIINKLQKINISKYFDDVSVDYTLNNYKILSSKCDNIIDLSVKIENCNKELEEYKDCFLNMPNNTTTDDELTENCYTFINPNCYNLYYDYKSVLPNCHYAQQFQNFTLLNNLPEITNTYMDICKYNPPKNIKAKFISDCRSYLIDEKCIFDYNFEMTNEELIQKCEIYTKECTNNYLNQYLNIPGCRLVEDKDVIHEFYFSKSKIKDNKHLCMSMKGNDNDIHEVNNLCEIELERYKICNLNTNKEFINENNLKSNCINFLNEECQAFYKNPFKNIPYCHYAMKNNFRNIEIFDKSNEKYKYYEEICLSNNSTIISTTSSIISTDATPTSSPTSTTKKTTTIKKTTTTKKENTTKKETTTKKTTITKKTNTTKKTTSTKKITTTKKTKTTTIKKTISTKKTTTTKKTTSTKKTNTTKKTTSTKKTNTTKKTTSTKKTNTTKKTTSTKKTISTKKTTSTKKTISTKKNKN
ncbi:subtilisin-like protein [Anaeromyces robustus]|uniref:Subtilisin-like protein n=1 Tax=Anaeromyces robustus TaxID=1754192 RepID=A0A1Y1WY33_9FUNG|nr:subtilisin-like protein [Anaeromyces robustus]|eukprot:ORX78116.1 subtilisin-like protein [Anaeromyces robustus]